nr:MAG TPA: hypothetical protein [Caudoviricetes sp.]
MSKYIASSHKIIVCPRCPRFFRKTILCILITFYINSNKQCQKL